MKTMIKREAKMNLTLQIIGLRPVKERLNTEEAKFWNALDEELKSTANLKHFRCDLKTRLLGGNR